MYRIIFLLNTIFLVPSKPLNVTAIVQSNTTVLLTWLIPLHPNGIITGYRVAYKKTSQSSHRVCNNTLQTTYSVDILIPYTNYTFWVKASTVAGFGMRSESRFAKTDEGGMPYSNF